LTPELDERSEAQHRVSSATWSRSGYEMVYGKPASRSTSCGDGFSVDGEGDWTVVVAVLGREGGAGPAGVAGLQQKVTRGRAAARGSSGEGEGGVSRESSGVPTLLCTSASALFGERTRPPLLDVSMDS
jgi:hypothetical protein